MSMKNSHSKLLFFLCTIFILVTISIAQQQLPDFLYSFCINDKGNYTNNSTYQKNLQTLLSNISSNTQIDYGFYNASIGLNSDRANAIALCRGDVSLDTCRSCIKNSTQKLTQVCPYYKEAIGWYSYCMLRYTNRSNIFGNREDLPDVYLSNTYNVSDADKFKEALDNLMFKLKDKAALGDSRYKFATGSVNATSFQNIYGLVQCTPDLSKTECGRCLDGAIIGIRTFSDNKQGGRYIKPSCSIRYDAYQFYTSSPPSPSPTNSPSPPLPSTNTTTTTKVTGGGNDTAMIVGITVSSIAVVAAVLGFCFYCYCKKCRPEDYETSQEILNGDLEDQDHTGEMQYFRLTTIMAATNNFSVSNKLGEGGFGPVYKGKLVDGKEVAVKRLSQKSGQGLKEFKNEVMFIVKLQHNNLVRLLGCCVERNEKQLVYEYLANTSLDVFLFDQEKCKQLDWDLRANIVSGIAKGIQYLHEDSRLKIIHRDLKASNILLDDEMNPKISDFGTARMFAPKQKEDSTNRPVGTYGYMAPEYAMEGLFSMKSDVYSFGILLLEIVSGKKNSGFYQTDHTHSQSLLSYVWQLWNEGKRQEFIDQNIIDTCSTTEALRWIHIALLCVQEDPIDRPSISSVILMLCSKISDLPRPSAPPFSVSRFLLSDQSSTTTGGTGNGFLASDQSSTSASLCR